METFGIRVKRARGRAGMTQGDLADACGMTQPGIQRWEGNATSEPGAIPLIRAAVAMRVRPEWLMLGQGPMRADDPAIDTELLQRAIAAVLESLRDAGAELDAGRQARAIALVYRLMQQGDADQALLQQAIALAR